MVWLGLSLLLLVTTISPAIAKSAEETGERPPASKIDLNRATLEQLETIPGVGPALAQRILDFREEHGPFRRVEDLLKVKGIGEKSFQKMQSYVVVEARS
jgi:competence protein ComEA